LFWRKYLKSRASAFGLLATLLLVVSYVVERSLNRQLLPVSRKLIAPSSISFQNDIPKAFVADVADENWESISKDQKVGFFVNIGQCQDHVANLDFKLSAGTWILSIGSTGEVDNYRIFNIEETDSGFKMESQPEYPSVDNRNEIMNFKWVDKKREIIEFFFEKNTDHQYFVPRNLRSRFPKLDVGGYDPGEGPC